MKTCVLLKPVIGLALLSVVVTEVQRMQGAEHTAAYKASSLPVAKRLHAVPR